MAVPLYLSKILAGWDDGKQSWIHHFASLPRDKAELNEERSGQSFAQWLQANAAGDVPWKVKTESVGKPALVTERIAAAQSGDTERLRELLDCDVVARLLDKDRLGRTVLHAASASGNLEAVQMLAARSSGWPVVFVPVKKGGILNPVKPQSNPLQPGGKVHGIASPVGKARGNSSPLGIKNNGKASPVHGSPRRQTGGSSPQAGSPRRQTGRSSPQAGQSPRRTRHAPPNAAANSLPQSELKGYESSEHGSSPRPEWRTATTGTATFKNMLDARDRAGNAPLHLAAADGHIEVVEELLSRGAEIELRNLAGRTALHVACMNHRLDVIAMLLSAGASARARDVEGRRAIDMTPSAEVHFVLCQAVGSSVAVRGGPTPFGDGDDDKRVTLNTADANFATEEEGGGAWDPEHGVRKLVGSAAPMFRGSRLPRIRPRTPDPPDPPFSWAQEDPNDEAGYPTRKASSKTVGWRGLAEGEEEEEESNYYGGGQAGEGRIAVRSGWYRTNERHRLHVPAQTLRSRRVGTDNVMEFERKKLSVKRMLAEMKWARDKERREAEAEAQEEGEPVAERRAGNASK